MPAGVGEPQLRAGVRAFPPDDDPHALGPGGQVQHAGDLRDPRARAHLAFAVVSGSPRRRGNLEDGVLDLPGEGEPGRVGQPPSRLGQPGQELLGAAAGIGADQHPAPQPGGQLGQREPGRLDMVAAVFDPAFPGRSMMASGSPDPPAPWSANTVSG